MARLVENARKSVLIVWVTAHPVMVTDVVTIVGCVRIVQKAHQATVNYAIFVVDALPCVQTAVQPARAVQNFAPIV